MPTPVRLGQSASGLEADEQMPRRELPSWSGSATMRLDLVDDEQARSSMLSEGGRRRGMTRSRGLLDAARRMVSSTASHPLGAAKPRAPSEDLVTEDHVEVVLEPLLLALDIDSVSMPWISSRARSGWRPEVAPAARGR